MLQGFFFQSAWCTKVLKVRAGITGDHLIGPCTCISKATWDFPIFICFSCCRIFCCEHDNGQEYARRHSVTFVWRHWSLRHTLSGSVVVPKLLCHGHHCLRTSIRQNFNVRFHENKVYANIVDNKQRLQDASNEIRMTGMLERARWSFPHSKK
jgi:hypothetical protein